MQSTEDTKQQIIDVADKHFRQYGFGKTTMAEIAKDCEMSAANLYRYFESKEDIGAEIALKCFYAKESMGREVLRRPDLSASARLEAFFLEILRYTYNLISDQPRLNELCNFISEERQGLIKRHLEVLRSVVAEILAEGNRTGEFDVPDIINTAEKVLIATVYFDYPPLVIMEKQSLEDLEHSAKGVLDLIVRGLAKR